MDYSKWDSLAHEVDEEEQKQKELTRMLNRARYMKEQDERKAKWVEKQKEEAKRKGVEFIPPDEHGHGHGGHGGHGGHSHSHNHNHNHNHNHDKHDHHHHHDHNHDHGHTHEHNHDKHNHNEHNHQVTKQEQVPVKPTPTQTTTYRRPTCGCGYADPEELKRLAAEAAKEPKLSPEEKNAKKVAAVNAAKEHGKELFAQGNYQEAFLLFERAVLIISGMSNLEPSVLDAMSKEEALLDLNMALCSLKLGNYKECIDNCNLALQLEPNNVKAFYRKACAYIGLAEYEQATALLKKAEELDPQNKEIKVKLFEIKKLEKEDAEKQKKFRAMMREKLEKSKAAANLTQSESKDKEDAELNEQMEKTVL